jgi:hypothetical protein
VEAATAIGAVTCVIHGAGVSSSQATPEVILHVDFYGTALVRGVRRGHRAGRIVRRHRIHVRTSLAGADARVGQALATTPEEELLALPMLQADQLTDPLHACQLSRRCNSLRVMAKAVRWGQAGSRINAIGRWIIVTPLARDELNRPREAGYRRMIHLCPVGRTGTPDEVGTLGARLMRACGAFITGSDFLMDGGVTASYRFGGLASE